MRCLRFLALAAALGLAACFVQHPQLIGAAETVEPGQWSGAWVAEPNRDGEEPGFFHVNDVDPAQGIFAVEEADADGNATGDKMEMHLRRVGQQLFLDVRDKADGPWMLFVVEEATPDKIVLAWKPAAAPFEAAIAKGDFKAKLSKNADGDVSDIVFAALTEKEAETLAKNWRDLFVAERITLKRFVVAD
ncbi:hypothetical protein [Dongia rigui]|uniref:Lipoprotein n=1 Tax=Dongia rigui TaxID=940149 RepID=A0ABU5DV60_9PROT|nr:hypothetical protein [Dongia rigui]MDY0871191.1 hypothetical protein [Dongia rigui]